MDFFSARKVLIIVFFLIFLFFLFFVYTLSKSRILNNNIPTPTIFPSLTPALSIPAVSVTPQYAPDEIIIKYKTGKAPDEMTESEFEEVNKVFTKAGVVSQEKLYKEKSSILKNYYLLKLKPGTSVLESINLIKTLNQIEYAEPNFTYKTQ